MTHYQLLGVMPSATPAEIRAAYLQLARRHHPDAGGSPERMREINAAWAVLSDSRARRAYDLSIGSARPGVGGLYVDDEQPVRTASEADDVDSDDRPVHTIVPLPGVVTVLPVAAFAGAVGAGIMGMMLTSGGLLGLSIVLFGLSIALMILLPLVQMTRGSRSRE